MRRGSSRIATTERTQPEQRVHDDVVHVQRRLQPDRVDLFQQQLHLRARAKDGSIRRMPRPLFLPNLPK